MGLFDKIKNVFFEEEEIEEIEDIPSPKKDKVIAKKIDNFEEKPKITKQSLNLEKEVIMPAKEIVTEKELVKEENLFKFPMMFEENDFLDEEITEVKPTLQPEKEVKKEVKKEAVHTLYETPIKEQETHLYEKKIEKSYFQPSPIISPIYGVLDKNYKKEEVIAKKEIKISARSSSTKLDIDTIRNKAYGDLTNDLMPSYNVEDEPDPTENTLYDISSDNTKPTVDKVTIQDAEEYFEDLGLEYNIDYTDRSKEKATGRRSTSKNETTSNTSKEKMEDNLFDLIESMYNKED